MRRIGPSGKKVEWNGINVFRVDKGKIAEEWWSEDILGLMQQIGAIPSPLW
jgi:predicted ester cyclase